jgi:hypothetical protein
MNRLVVLSTLVLACSSRPMRLLPPDAALPDAANDDFATNVDSSASVGIVPTVSVSPSDEACALSKDGIITCWGNEYYSAPTGTFISLSAGSDFACAVKADGSLFCWGADGFGVTSPPAGSFTSVSTGWDFACALRTDGTIACWGNSAHGDTTPPAGTFKFISLAPSTDGYDCGVRSNGTLACWGNNAQGENKLPAGTFTSISVGRGDCPCGVRTDGTLACCKVPSGAPTVECSTPSPPGLFIMISGDFLLTADGTIVRTCPLSEFFTPTGTFTSVSVGSRMGCAVRADGTVFCWAIP